jgi:hypothetical protein
MKKLTFILISLVLELGIANSGLAQEDLAMSMTVRKDVRLNDNTTLYRLGFNLSGDPLKKVRQVLIALPNGRKMKILNKFHLNVMNLEVRSRGVSPRMVGRRGETPRLL